MGCSFVGRRTAAQYQIIDPCKIGSDLDVIGGQR
jgi:hypothetical protein